MKKLLLLALFLIPHSVFAAIAFDATQKDNGNGNSPQYFSQAVAATSTTNLLYINIEVNGIDTDSCTNVYANGVEATRIDRDFNTGFGEIYNYYVMGVGTRITLTWLGCASGNTNSSWMSYTGVKATGQPDAHTKNECASCSSLLTSVTTVNDNSWVLSSAYDVSGSLAASTGVTGRINVSNVIASGDSNAPVTPAGSYSMTWTGTAGVIDVLQASFQPDVAAATTSTPKQDMIIFGLIAPKREIFTV